MYKVLETQSTLQSILNGITIPMKDTINELNFCKNFSTFSHPQFSQN